MIYGILEYIEISKFLNLVELVSWISQLKQ